MKIDRKQVKRAFTFFVIAVLAGFGYSVFFPTFADSFFLDLAEATMEDIDLSLPWQNMAWMIFLNNIVIMYGMACAGLLHWIFPMIILGVNGVVVGLIIGVAYQVIGVGGVLVALLPHGIFEITGFILASSIGFSVNKKGYYLVRSRNWAELRKICNELLFILTRSIAPLIIIGAIIEGFLIGVLV